MQEDDHLTDEASPPLPEGRVRRSTWQEMRVSEDWWAVWIGAAILAASFAITWASRPADFAQRISQAQESGGTVKLASPMQGWLEKPGSWESDPRLAFVRENDPSTQADESRNVLPGLVGAFLVSLILFGVGVGAMGGSFCRYAGAFCVVFLLAVLAYMLAGQVIVEYYNLEYVLWALLVGLILSNTVGTPQFLRPAVRTELYIKTGLVLLGAEILLGQLLALGVPGIFVSWVVTPIVLIGTYAFGQKVLKLPSRSLNMVISADMSVCGVSAAIATAGACRAKKEELSLAIGMSLTFTAIMMVVMPAVAQALGMSNILAGAWMGGTIDSTGAVAAAGGVLGDDALKVATTIKMIQNILIGITAFGVAVYWVTRVERTAGDVRPDAWEIWYRFPKFVIGFVLASIVVSTVYEAIFGGNVLVNAATGATKSLRGWFFCLAFVSIGLETNFRELGQYFRGGKPLILYLCGQTFNLLLTLAMAWLMFEVIFKDAVQSLLNS